VQSALWCFPGEAEKKLPAAERMMNSASGISLCIFENHEANKMDVLLIPLTAILMPLVLAPTVMFMKARQERRKWEHLERMKALEANLPMPGLRVGASHWSIAAIGAGVPTAAVVAALLTPTVFTPASGDQIAILAIAWGCALLISALAMGTSLILAFMQKTASKHAESVDPFSNGKPVFDPDAFDVVSTRG
jgi:hypothetical protein